jgi:hypothetical protein
MIFKSKRGDCRCSRSRKLLRPTPTRRKRCVDRGRCGLVGREQSSSVPSQDSGGTPGVWLRVRMLNSLVFSLRTTVRATRPNVEFDRYFSETLEMVPVRRVSMTILCIRDDGGCGESHGRCSGASGGHSGPHSPLSDGGKCGASPAHKSVPQMLTRNLQIAEKYATYGTHFRAGRLS